MINKKEKLKIRVKFDEQMKWFQVILNFNGSNHTIGTRKTEYSANNLAVSLSNKIKVQYIDLKLYYPNKKEKTLFDIKDSKPLAEEVIKNKGENNDDTTDLYSNK